MVDEEDCKVCYYQFIMEQPDGITRYGYLYKIPSIGETIEVVTKGVDYSTYTQDDEGFFVRKLITLDSTIRKYKVVKIDLISTQRGELNAKLYLEDL